MRLFKEVHYWDKQRGDFTIPYAATEMSTGDKMRNLIALREHVMLVVRDYNIILEALDADERKLFQEHIRKVNKRVNSGLSRFTWNYGHIKEFFVKESRKDCAELYAVVVGFKKKNDLINKLCRSIASTALILIEKNFVYQEGIFE